MEKLLYYPGEGETGVHSHLIVPGRPEFVKTAAPLHDEVQQFIAHLKPHPDKTYALINALGAAELYGCFPAGTAVSTTHGDVPIEDVAEGDLVLTHRNRYRPVLRTQVRPHQGSLVDVRLVGHPLLMPALVATPNHEVRAVLRDEFVHKTRRHVWTADTSRPIRERRREAMAALEFDWVPIGDLQRGDKLVQPFPVEEDEAALGTEWGSQDVAFLMGLYAAEGCVIRRYDRAHRPLSGVIYVVSAQETDVIERARLAAERCGHKLTIGPGPEGADSTRLQLSWAPFARLCQEHIGDGAVRKRLSLGILRMPRRWQSEFFWAYAVGDGCESQAAKDLGSVRCVSASAGLLADVRLLVARFGWSSSVSGRHNTQATWYSGKPIFTLLIGGSQIGARGVHETAKSYIHPDGYILSSVRSVHEYEWEGDVYNLEVEEDNSYVASQLAVHNSNLNADAFSIASLKYEPPGWRDIPPWEVELRRAAAEKAAYGHTTFYLANAFRHHRNKPHPPHNHPIYGRVVLSVWNDVMKRVELVEELDHKLCRAAGGWDIIERLENGEFLPVSMGCFLKGTLVTMADGTRKPIEDVQVGDLVLTHKGRGKRVTAVHRRRYEGGLYGVKGDAYEPVWCTEEHPWWTVPDEQVKTTHQYRRWRRDLEAVSPDWTHASCLGEHHLLAPVLDEVLTPDYVDRAFARLFGYYLAEGHVLRDRNKEICGLELSTHRDDPVHGEIEQLCADFETRNPPYTYDRANTELGQGIIISDKRLARLCYEHGGAYAKKKRLSHSAMRWHPEMQREVLGAYANGDGTGPPDGSLKLSTASAQLAWQWLVVLPRLGILPSIGKLTHKAGTGFSKKDTYEWVVHIGKQRAQGLHDVTAKVVEAEIRTVRNLRRIIGGYVVVPLRKLTKTVGSVEVVNLSVEEDESYCVHGLAVHNCRVKFDVCSVCAHRAPTRAFYCVHMSRKDPRFHPNMILPDGRRIWVWNPHPRFFDISYVLIGADRTAKVMALLSSGKRVFVFVKSETLTEPSAERAHDLGYSEQCTGLNEKDQGLLDLLRDEPQVKAAAQQKVGTERKVADIIKEVPPDRLSGRAVNLLAGMEPNLPRQVLDQMAQRRGTVSEDLRSSLGTAARLGVVLKPQEYQRLVLTRCGQPGMADKMDDRGDVFSPSTAFGAAMRLSDNDLGDVRSLLLPFVPLRSMLGPVLKKRVTVLISANPSVPEASEHCATSPLLDEISRSYNGYRMGLLALLARSAGLGPTAELDPLAELFRRKPIAIEDEPLAGLSTSGPVVYLIRAHWGATDRLGPEVDERIIRNHPELVAKLAFAVPA